MEKETRKVYYLTKKVCDDIPQLGMTPLIPVVPSDGDLSGWRGAEGMKEGEFRNESPFLISFRRVDRGLIHGCSDFPFWHWEIAPSACILKEEEE